MVVEPVAETRQLLANIVSETGVPVELASDGREALALLDRRPVNLVLLALNLPDIDGLELLRRLRVRANDLAIIVVSVRSTEGARIAGLEAGADDYIVKPFSPAELFARVNARLRGQLGPRQAEILTFPGLSIDPSRREVLVNGRPVELRHREFDLLHFLASSPGQVFSRVQLLEQVWQSHEGWQNDATITEHVRRVRGVIEPDPSCPTWIHTIHGVGYQFERRARPRQ